MRGRISLVPYDPGWPRLFEEERILLANALAPWLSGGIHHVGSTAVPGLPAKPVLDIVAGVRELAAAREGSVALRSLGYHPAPHRPSIAHHFSRPSPVRWEATHNLHLAEPGSDLWRERLAFRDALRRDSNLAAEYRRLKLALAGEHPHDLDAYTAGKRAFVERVLAAAAVRPGCRSRIFSLGTLSYRSRHAFGPGPAGAAATVARWTFSRG